jgi:uncharacterized protein (TIGR03437 family)
LKTKTILLVLFLGACAWQSSAQPAFDSSGNGMLTGNYYFRQVVYFGMSDGTLSESMSVVGNINFDGNGNYTLSNATILDSSASTYPTPQSFSGSGTYSIAASGEGFITGINPNVDGSDQIVGLVSPTGLFVGSTTENTEGYNDLFIAAPVSSSSQPAISNATLSGSYQVAYIDPSRSTQPGDALMTFSADGMGNIQTLNASEYVETFQSSSANTGTPSQTFNGVTYSFPNAAGNAAGQLNFGSAITSTSFLGGTVLLNISPDGNFIFGGNFTGADMFVGVRNATGDPSNYQALYYQAGINDDFTSYPMNPGLDSYFGATNIFSGNNIIADERDNSLAYYMGSSDYTYSDSYTLNGDGSASDSYYNYWASMDGTIRIGYGVGPYLGINVAFQGPSLSGSGVYLNPAGVVNAASSAPFTAFLSPGEFLTLYGSNLASTTDSAVVPFPNSLDGVQVMINGVAAPIYFVSPAEIDAIVPYGTTGSVTQIQVVNSQGSSNLVTQFTGETSTGVFTNNPVGGNGYAAALRPDGSVISESNPAQVGETEAVFLAGMGTTTNQPADGTAAPTSPLAYTNATPGIFLIDTSGDSVPATVTFSGLAPGFAGLYQINFTIPSGLVNGDTTLDIYSGVDSENAESILPITGGNSSAVPSARANSANPRPRLRRPRRFAVENRLNKSRP